MRNYYILVFIVAMVSCQTDQDKGINKDGLFRGLSETSSGLDFINEVVSQDSFNVLTYRNYYNGGGVAIGDIDNDGLSDIYFSANMGQNHLYRNNGGLQFKDITTQAGVAGTMAWSTGVTMADVNADGWLDIYVCNSGDVTGDNKENELFINNGDGTFSEKAAQYGLNDSGFSTHASFFDYDRDGDLDMYLVNNSFKDPSRIDFTNIRHIRNDQGGDKLFQNDGNGSFEDVSASAGIYGSEIGFGLGVSVSDLNGDFWPDIYVSNDFWERDYLYINQQDGTFSEELPDRISMTSTSSMGADVGDLDNNGTFEIFSTDMLPATNERLKKTTIFNDYNLQDLKYRNDYHYQYTQNCLQLNDGQAHFYEVGHLTGVAATDWSWGALIFDFDNDGLNDIFVSNGVFHDITDLDFSDFIEDRAEVEKIVREKGRFNFADFLEYLPSTKIANYAFHNSGNLQFNNKANELGLGTPSFSNGSAYGDLDNDGDLDLVINNVNELSQIFENRSERLGHHYLKIKLDSETKNKQGIGATIKLNRQGQSTYHQLYTSRGFQSSTEPLLTIGLGTATMIDTLDVFWPDGQCTRMVGVTVDQTITVNEKTENCALPEDLAINTLLKRIEPFPDSPPAHVENLFNDFDIEPLMPHMVSTEGPEVLVGDLDMNGTQDFVLLGASQQADQVILQSSSGVFRISDQPDITSDATYESTCGLITDLDGDGDPDIVVGSGGNDPSRGPEIYLVRVYLNNGKGLFKKSQNPSIRALGNFSVIEEIKLSDTRRGLFIGGRLVPGNYGLDPRNYLFVSEGNGEWVDVTTEATGKTGMITDAEAVDLDSDGDEDLVVVGEWMPITVFETVDGVLTLKGNVDHSFGLWQSITATDVNGDDLPDIVAGNWGLNSKLQASADQPLKMLVNDFDKNGKSECIIEWYAPEDDNPSLFASKNDLTRQLPALKKVILKNAEYATKSMSDLFTDEQINSSVIKFVNNLKSSVLINRSGFRFDLKALPSQAQYAPVFAICTDDLNGDGFQDLMLGGNMYGLKPEIGRLDASFGTVLLGSADGNFSSLSSMESGLRVNGEIRSIKTLQQSNGTKSLVIGINNQPIRIYAY